VAYGPRVISVVLSGGLDDGTAGMEAVKARGGIAVIQDPRDAQSPSMPTSVLGHVAVDHIRPAAAIGPLLVELAHEAVTTGGWLAMSNKMEIETRIAMEHNALKAGVMTLGDLTPYTCPECHGTLLQLDEGGILRFRCHTGHAFSVQSLLAEIGESIEETLWGAVRVIEERMLLLRHVAKHVRTSGAHEAADQLLKEARDAEQQVELIRLAVLRHEEQTKTHAVPAGGAPGPR
jgi:two-component system chemotaxis response regulator CheB